MSNVASAEHARSILVVEDDDAIRILMKRVLSRAGYLVTEATDGAVAIERLQVERYDAIILDLMMPRVNGFEVLAYMREHLDARKCVIVASAAADRTIASVDETLVISTLRKPFDLETLLGAVQRCVGE